MFTLATPTGRRRQLRSCHFLHYNLRQRECSTDVCAEPRDWWPVEFNYYQSKSNKPTTISFTGSLCRRCCSSPSGRRAVWRELLPDELQHGAVVERGVAGKRRADGGADADLDADNERHDSDHVRWWWVDVPQLGVDQQPDLCVVVGGDPTIARREARCASGQIFVASSTVSAVTAEFNEVSFVTAPSANNPFAFASSLTDSYFYFDRSGISTTGASAFSMSTATTVTVRFEGQSAQISTMASVRHALALYITGIGSSLTITMGSVSVTSTTYNGATCTATAWRTKRCSEWRASPPAVLAPTQRSRRQIAVMKQIPSPTAHSAMLAAWSMPHLNTAHRRLPILAAQRARNTTYPR
jgi:hypothetical protein